jgi:malate dehydrogenase (oxaloacetate-decarboxylating)
MQFATKTKDRIELADVIANIDATILIGLSTVGGAFTEPIVREMARKVDRPIIFPLSNPTSKSEAKAEDLIHWTNGRALLATDSPFAPVNYDGRKILASIEKQPHSTDALPTKCVTVSVRVFLVPSLKRSLAGISTMKRFGNSGASDPQISAHGPCHRRQSYLSLHLRRLPNESRRNYGEQ